MIGLVAATAAGTRGCERLTRAWPERTRVYPGPVGEALRAAFGECEQVVAFLATGAAVRLLAPLLGAKDTDPGVVTVDEAHRHAVALLGGHAGGANALAAEVAAVLGARPVVTTATDAVGVTALDTLPYPAEGAVAPVTRALLDGTLVLLREDAVWPLPALPGTTATPAPGPARHEYPAPDAAPGPSGIPAPAVDAAPARECGPGAHVGPGLAPSPDSAPNATPGPGAIPCPTLGAGQEPASGPAPGVRPGTGQDAASGAAAARRSGPGPVPGPEAGDAAGDGRPTVWVTDRLAPGRTGAATVFVRPPSLVVGVGGSRGVGADEVLGLVRAALAEAGLSERSVTALSTVEAKRDEPGIVAAAARLGATLRVHPADALAAVPVPNPSAAPLAAVGTPSVAEAAALLEAGRGAGLLVPKRKSAMATVAVARRRPRGRLAVVGLGPGARDLLTPRAARELRRASVVVGLDQYVDQVRDLLSPGARVLESGLGAEQERARTAVAQARAGRAVALIGSGDAGVYAMASPALAEASDDIDVVGVPGVTAALAAAALLGAPLGHDHVSISLSDLHTPWEVIERRVRAAAESDLVVTFYNPRSRGRDWQLPKALAILSGHRAPDTAVGVVRAASRPDEHAWVTTLAGLDVAHVDMVTVVTVGNTATRTVAGRMVTPRGYRWQS